MSLLGFCTRRAALHLILATYEKVIGEGRGLCEWYSLQKVTKIKRMTFGVTDREGGCVLRWEQICWWYNAILWEPHSIVISLHKPATN